MSNARTYGTIHSEQKPFVIQHADSTDYLLGGRLVMKNGKIDKVLFDGGYAQASAVSNTTKDKFAFNFYNQDHLGNNREVVDAKGVVQQVTNYYPFGAPYADATAIKGAAVQPYKYNGKELDLMHGLNTYDYGARQHDPILARWDRMDPLCEKYYSVSPYAYCNNNPVMLVDPDGREWYTNNNGTLLWNPQVHSQNDLQKGYTYVGTTYNDQKNNIQYREDGTILCPNEKSGIDRMTVQQKVSISDKNRFGKEQSACLLDDEKGSMIVFPDNWNSGSESKLPSGYTLTSDVLSNGQGETFKVAAHIHSHPGSKSNQFSNTDAIFGVTRPGLPMFVIHADGNTYYGAGMKNGKFTYGNTPKGYNNLLHYSKIIRNSVK